MSALSPFLRSLEGGRIAFWCPGCKEAHQIATGDGPGPRWGYNGNPDKPTFTPSVLVTGRNFTDKGEADYEAWCAAGHPARTEPFESAPMVCHTFVTNGQIQFLGDCTHALAGQTVDLPPWPGSES